MTDVNPLKNIKAVSLRSQVYAQLKKELTMGTWKAGEKLPSEKDLCQSFGVSRVTVRGAIQQLEILGLVETRQGGGTFVKDFSSIEQADAFHPQIQIKKNQDLITVLEYRKIIEKGTIALAQEKTGPQDIIFLEETLKIMKDAHQDIEAYAEADLAFHYRLARITGNSIIIKVHEFINEILSAAMRDLVHQVGRNIGPVYHRKIINALKKRDKAACEALMEEHIEANIQAIKKEIRNRKL
jgi:GntR family transcriptional repressor for pyruvate dehydrogenase complex